MSQSVLMVICPEQFRDEELNIPRQRLQEAGWQVDVASTRAGTAQGMIAAQEPVSLTVDQVNPDNYQGVIVVGGMGAIEFLWDNTTLHRLVREFDAQQKVVASICLSGVVLAKAGLLKDKQATVYKTPESYQIFVEWGVNYTGDSVTVDGRLITANGPDAAEAFAHRLIEALSVSATQTAALGTAASPLAG